MLFILFLLFIIIFHSSTSLKQRKSLLSLGFVSNWWKCVLHPLCPCGNASCGNGGESIIAGGGGLVGGSTAAIWARVSARVATPARRALANRCAPAANSDRNPIRGPYGVLTSCIAPGGARTPLPRKRPCFASCACCTAIRWLAAAAADCWTSASDLFSMNLWLFCDSVAGAEGCVTGGLRTNFRSRLKGLFLWVFVSIAPFARWMKLVILMNCSILCFAVSSLGLWEPRSGDDATALTCLSFPLTATPRVPGIRIKATMAQATAMACRNISSMETPELACRWWCVRDQRTCKNACPME